MNHRINLTISSMHTCPNAMMSVYSHLSLHSWGAIITCSKWVEGGGFGEGGGKWMGKGGYEDGGGERGGRGRVGRIERRKSNTQIRHHSINWYKSVWELTSVAYIYVLPYGAPIYIRSSLITRSCVQVYL